MMTPPIKFIRGYGLTEGQLGEADCSVMAPSQTGILTETQFWIRQLIFGGIYTDVKESAQLAGKESSEYVNATSNIEVELTGEVELLPVVEAELSDVEDDVKCADCGRGTGNDVAYAVDFANYRMPDGRRGSMKLLIPCCRASCE